MVRIRLKRTGTRNAVCFRVVVMDQRSSRDGKAIEEVGFYNPRSKEEKINLERIAYWAGVGAEMSDTVKDIVERAKGGIVLKDGTQCLPAKLEILGAGESFVTVC